MDLLATRRSYMVQNNRHGMSLHSTATSNDRSLGFHAVRVLLVGYFLMSGITWTGGGESGLAGRITVADVIMLMLVSMYPVIGSGKYFLSKFFCGSFALIAYWTASSMWSAQPESSLVEVAGHVFAFAGGSVILFYLLSMDYEDRVSMAVWWMRTSSVLALVGMSQMLYDITGFGINVYQLSGAQAYVDASMSAGLVGTFRNTGQSGAYFLVAASLALALYWTGVGSSRKERLFHAVILSVAVVLSIKRAAIIGLIVGIACYGAMSGSRVLARTVGVVVVSVALLTAAISSLTEASEAFKYRAQKLSTDRIESFYSSFFEENIKGAVAAFDASPVLGAGLGGVKGIYTEEYEIHSTYFNVAASGGVLGLIIYMTVMILFILDVRSGRGVISNRLGRMMTPMLVGLLTSWGYTYHFRKREFWILAAIVISLTALAHIRLSSGRSRIGVSLSNRTESFGRV